MSRDAIYFLAPTRSRLYRPDVENGWRIVRVLEHGPYHERRPASWRGPHVSAVEARVAATDLPSGLNPKA
jgi:hypothetical protein